MKRSTEKDEEVEEVEKAVIGKFGTNEFFDDDGYSSSGNVREREKKKKSMDAGLECTKHRGTLEV